MVNLGRCIGDARMTEVTIFDGPCNVAVMASTAILAIDNLQHVDAVAARLEFETQVAVTDFAAETYAMKPVREDDRPHARLVGEFVDYDITILGPGCLEIEPCKQHPKERNRHP